MRSISFISAGLLLCLCGFANAAPLQLAPSSHSSYIERVAGTAITVDISANRALPGALNMSLGDILTFVRSGPIVRTQMIPPQVTNRYGAPAFQLLAREAGASDGLFAQYTANLVGTFTFTVNRGGVVTQFVVIVHRY
jgi:hypothetical protein